MLTAGGGHKGVCAMCEGSSDSRHRGTINESFADILVYRMIPCSLPEPNEAQRLHREQKKSIGRSATDECFASEQPSLTRAFLMVHSPSAVSYNVEWKISRWSTW